MKWTLLLSAAITASHPQLGTGDVPGLSDQSTSVPPFNVSVELTPRAAAELRRRRETIVVVAYFYGLANKRGAKYADEMGQIYWSEEQDIELPFAGIARFRSRKLNASLLNYFEGRKPEVLINVVSGRRTDRDNLLACDIFEDSVYLAVKRGIQISCDLIH